MLPFSVIVNTNAVEPGKEIGFWFDAVKTSRQLQHVYLCHQFKLLAAFVEVYQAIFCRNFQCCVDHHQIGQKCSKVWYSSLNYVDVWL